MERVNDGRILWQKLGGGGFMLHGKLIKSKDKFRATPNEIPNAFKDVVVPLEDYVLEPQVVDAFVAKKEVNYSMQQRGKSKSWFDVVDGKGKAINAKALTKEQATSLLKDILE
jgi:hypothetical protein